MRFDIDVPVKHAEGSRLAACKSMALSAVAEWGEAIVLERRIVRRRRVCLAGALTGGLTGPIAEVRIRNLSAGGAEIVVPEGQLASADVALMVARTDVRRQARVVWRRLDRFGLQFTAERSACNEATPIPQDPFARLLSARRIGSKS